MLEITLLGGFRATVDGQPVPTDRWRHRRGADLVKLLALTPGHRLHREQVMEAFWPEQPPERSSANLRKAIHFARRALGSDAAVGSEAGMVALAPGLDVGVDVERFEEAARTALATADEDTYATAVQLYTGDLLPEDRYALWAEDVRERLRLRFVQVLKAARLWERVLEVDRADEEAHRALMAEALAAGDRGAAVRRFERLRETLRLDLGIGPEPESVRLYEQVLVLEGVDAPTSAQRARVLLAWGLVHLQSGDLEEAERSAEDARALAIEAGLGREIGDASALLGLVASAQGRWQELFRSEFEESVHGSPWIASLVFDAHLCLAEFFLFGESGHEGLAPMARELLEVANDAGSIQGRALATLLLGEIDLLSGRFAEAETNLSEAVRLHKQVGALSGQAVAVERLAEVAIARGQRWRATRVLPRALRLAEASALAEHLVVRVHGACIEAGGTVSRCLEAIRRGDDALAGTDVCPPCSMGFRVAATIAFARAGELEHARRRLEEAERIAAMWHRGPWLASVWEARAELRLAESDRAQAAALYKEAAEQFARVGRPVDEARCRAAGSGGATGAALRPSRGTPRRAPIKPQRS